ncbi:peptidylprolyl isomerase [uncultured Muriicola sp.]|uniref:peptidylprolyl isomerase n=1 Tax=uncultured Muriicola sp. TaxID=1583102 RepID=UPI00262961C4|nr:peptidylprolyl isomerase [uncultured Muriicola sp.]
MKNTYLLFATIFILFTGCKSSQYTHLGDGIFADIKTNKGDIIVKLEHEKTPVTVANFISLAEGNSPFVNDEYKEKKYFDGLTFHRVMKDFMIQGGDPTATGTGNPGYRFKDEFVDSLRHDKAGILAMANGGPKTNGSQFFITLKPTPWLDGVHTVFGEVIEGMAVVDSIGVTKTAAKDKPVVDVVMNSVEIIRNGKEAKNFDAVQIMSDYFAAEEAEIAAMIKMKADFAAEMLAQKNSMEALPSGLKIIILNEGTGAKPKVGQKVLVNYAGYLEDGSMFDSNYEEVAKKYKVYNQDRKDGGGYEPFPMDYSPDARLIPGFKEGMMSMKVGDKIRVFIPPHLGYGQQGSGPIPPNANLVFDLEIVDLATE